VLIAAVAVSTVFGWTGARAQESANHTNNTYAIDADPNTSGIQDTVTVAVGSTFTFETVITAAPDAYQAEQVSVSWNPAVVAYDSGPVNHILGQQTLCAPGAPEEGESHVFTGCAQDPNAAPNGITATGPTFTWTMKCVAEGSTALHFDTSADTMETIATNFALKNAVLGNPVLHDATVNCGNSTPGPATPTGTAKPGATPTPNLPEVATPNPTQIEEAKTPGSPAQATVTALAGAATVRSLIVGGKSTATAAVEAATVAALEKTPGSGAKETATARAAAANGNKDGGSSASSRTSDSGSSHTGLIIGIIVAVAVVLLAGAGGVVALRRRSGS
jgi:hypothetical protein